MDVSRRRRPGSRKQVMRNFISYLSMVFVGATSCINTINVPESYQRIYYEAAIGANTKSYGSLNETYPPDVPFNVWAYSDSDIVIGGEEAKYIEGIWMTEKEHLWPSSAQALDFYAFSPAGSPAGITKETGVYFKGFDINSHADFLCATPVLRAVKPKADAPVCMIFQTPLCEVEFNVYTSSEEKTSIWIDSIELLDYAQEGDYSQMPIETWSGLRNVVDITFFEGHLDLTYIPQIIGSSTLMIPQRLKPVIHYSYTIDGSESIINRTEVVDMTSLPPAASGKKRIYTIKVTEDVVTVQSPI